ncbi:PAS domain S-box protein [Paracoccus lutimaris]|uniref:PAS domain S-box-containing protein n=1 Tax=Paracoccus lutimaris TaxID=1490030 RepID=A0A368ZDS1_9RHOB|nr:PAS domain-containing protein [Paracoccus lutimaris]RCW88634.1 PAS domain S-box-containing protein [Paracoccus lutimaris]
MSDVQLLQHDMEWAMRAIRTHRAVLILDLVGRIVAVNQSCLRMCGYRCDELIGRPVMVLLDPSEKVPGRLGSMLDARHGQEHRIHGLCQISKAGRRFRVDARICPIHDSRGDICLNVLFLRESIGEDGPLHSVAPELAGAGAAIIQLPGRPVEQLPDRWDSAAGYGRVYPRHG